MSLIDQWASNRTNLRAKFNPYTEFPEEELWQKWENLCQVPPLRFALVNVDLPYDMAQLAQVMLSSQKIVPHIACYLVGETLDFMNWKVRNKIMSWNINEDLIKWLPRRPTSLLELKNQGYRLIGTSPNQGENALEYELGKMDVVVIGGAKGLSKKNLDLLDKIIKIPCSAEVPFLTTPTVIPILAYPELQRRGLWTNLDS